jgi:hypothetical protein
MRNHIYLHTSNLNIINKFKNDDLFQSCYEYPIHEIENLHPNEYGRIKTKHNYYHILVGQIRQENCPWCAAIPFIKRIENPGLTYTAEYCMQCQGCGARGPILYVNSMMNNDDKYMDEVRCLIKHKFKTRRQWDDGLVNPYEQSNISNVN